MQNQKQKRWKSLNKFRKAAIEIMKDNIPAGANPKECWLWLGPLDRDGYGYIRIVIGIREQVYSVHRLSFEYHKKQRLCGDLVRHDSRCPRECFNPFHLLRGSHKDNTADMIRAGRAAWQKPPISEEAKKCLENESARHREKMKAGRRQVNG